jgi:hypothetical protein
MFSKGWIFDPDGKFSIFDEAGFRTGVHEWTANF